MNAIKFFAGAVVALAIGYGIALIVINVLEEVQGAF